MYAPYVQARWGVSICMSVVVHVCSESAGRWCCLDAGHTDIFEAEVGLSHCMSMSPRVTPVWLLQEMTQISPSAFRDTASERGKWRRWCRRSNQSKTWWFLGNLGNVCALFAWMCIFSASKFNDQLSPTHTSASYNTIPPETPATFCWPFNEIVCSRALVQIVVYFCYLFIILL